MQRKIRNIGILQENKPLEMAVRIAIIHIQESNDDMITIQCSEISFAGSIMLIEPVI